MNIRHSAIMIISHQERILNIADEIVVLRDGQVDRQGPRDAVLPEERLFCVLTEGREAELLEREALVDGRDTLADERLLLERPTLAEERDPPPDGLETLEEERLEPPPYEERPALEAEDREAEPAEDDPRLTEEDAERPPPPLD